MKKISFTHCLLALVMIGFYALPALASQSPHWAENNINCLDCHITHQGPKTPCTDCHNNLNGSGYSKQSAPKVDSHVAFSCEACHDPHTSAQCTTPLVTGTFSSYQVNAQTTTFTIGTLNVIDTDWSDPSTWAVKSGTERGLIFTVTLGLWDSSTSEFVDFSAEVVAADATSITVNGIHAGVNLTGPPDFSLIYGQLVKGTINSKTVIFTGPKTFAQNDGLGSDGNDSTPDGVCQVCHTQTSYWRNDGTLTTHHDGEVCTSCHAHTNGFVVALGTHHPTHLRIQEYDGSETLTCTDCHENGFDVKSTITVTNDWLDWVKGLDGDPATVRDGLPDTDTFNPQPILSEPGCNEWAIDNADGIPGNEDDYVCVDPIPGVETGKYSCATLCHPQVQDQPGVCSDNPVTACTSSDVTACNNPATAFCVTEFQGSHVTAFLSALTSQDTDLVVELNASNSNCDGASGCSFVIDPLDCTVSGGNGADIVIVTCPDQTPRTFAVAVTDIDSGEVGTATADATPSIIEVPVAANDISVVHNGDGTCTASATNVGTAVRARIYWGDKTSTTVTDPAAELASGITHSCGPVVRVALYDANYNITNLIF